jgi:hypothetical protein
MVRLRAWEFICYSSPQGLGLECPFFQQPDQVFFVSRNPVQDVIVWADVVDVMGVGVGEQRYPQPRRCLTDAILRPAWRVTRSDFHCVWSTLLNIYSQICIEPKGVGQGKKSILFFYESM